MHENAQKTTILALELRLQRCGFGVLKGRVDLLDWGVKTYRTADLTYRARLAGKRILPLLTMFRPAVIVANHVSGLNTLRGPEHHHIVRAVARQARQHSAELVLLGRDQIRQAFEKVGPATKDGIAAHVALRFPELTWKLPSPRKVWESEHHNMPIFDAISLGLTYLARTEDTFPAGSGLPKPPTPG